MSAGAPSPPTLGAARGSERLLANPVVVADSGNRLLPRAAPKGPLLVGLRSRTSLVKLPSNERPECEIRG